MLPIDSVNQNLDALTLEELLEIKATVNTLIAKKSLETNENKKTLSTIEFNTYIKYTNNPVVNVMIRKTLHELFSSAFLTIPSTIPSIKSSIFSRKLSFFELSNIYFKSSIDDVNDIDDEFSHRFDFAKELQQIAKKKDDSLETVINLVDEWINDEFSQQIADKKDDSLETVINLVDEWINDESGYDEKVYPQIEESLKQNHISL